MLRLLHHLINSETSYSQHLMHFFTLISFSSSSFHEVNSIIIAPKKAGNDKNSLLSLNLAKICVKEALKR